MAFMGDKVQQSSFSASVATFIEKNTPRTRINSSKAEKDYLYSAELTEDQKLDGTIDAKKPALADPKKAAQEQADEDLAHGFAAISKIFFGTLSTQVATQQKLSGLNRDFGAANLQATQNTYQKQGDLLKQQQDVNKKIKSSGDLQSIFTTFFTVALLASTGVGVLGAIGSAFASAAEGVLGGAVAAEEGLELETVGEAAVEGIGEEEVASVPILEISEEEVAEEAASEVGNVEVEATDSESMLKKILVGDRTARLKALTGLGGGAIGAADPALTAYFAHRNSGLKKDLAEKTADLGTSMSEMKFMNSMFTYLQSAVKKEPDLVQEHADTASSLTDLATSYFSAEKENAKTLVAHAV